VKAAADAAVDWVDDTLGERRGDGSVGRIAAGTKDLGAGLGSQALDAGDDTPVGAWR
jgi:hypothetical protein